jgi:hypothetical protein
MAANFIAVGNTLTPTLSLLRQGFGGQARRARERLF